jgi:hypothetical protein
VLCGPRIPVDSLARPGTPKSAGSVAGARRRHDLPLKPGPSQRPGPLSSGPVAHADTNAPSSQPSRHSIAEIARATMQSDHAAPVLPAKPAKAAPSERTPGRVRGLLGAARGLPGPRRAARARARDTPRQQPLPAPAAAPAAPRRRARGIPARRPPRVHPSPGPSYVRPRRGAGPPPQPPRRKPWPPPLHHNPRHFTHAAPPNPPPPAPPQAAEHAADAAAPAPAAPPAGPASPRAWLGVAMARLAAAAAAAAPAPAPPPAGAPAGDEEDEAAADEDTPARDQRRAPAAAAKPAPAPPAACRPPSALAAQAAAAAAAHGGHGAHHHVLTHDSINPAIVKTQYAVRGELYLRAEELRREGREVIFTNSECGGLRGGLVGALLLRGGCL